jgi:hypothetical protein
MVQSYGGGFERFRVRLPAGAQLIRRQPADAEAQDPAYRITLEEPPARGRGAAPVLVASDRQVVLVELREKQQGPVSVELSTEQSIGPENGRSSVELAGFEVVGAVRQFGDVAVNVAEDWQARWSVGPNVRQVDPSELDPSLQQAGATAAFQYDRQPWSLGVRVGTRRLRTHVTPRYELEYSGDEVRLAVELAYQMFGARAFEFRIGLEGWELAGDPIESGGLIDSERLFLDSDGTLVLPLAQPATRRANIAFRLRRTVARDNAPIRLPLPVPLADSVGSGELIVRAATDVDLRPDLASSNGLTPIAVGESSETRGSDGMPEIRYRTVSPKTVFAANFVSRPGEVAVRTTAKIELTATDAHIEQQYDFDVRFAPIQDLRFNVPSGLTVDQELIEAALIAPSGAVDGEEIPLILAPVNVESHLEAQAGVRPWRIVLPQSRLGRFGIRIRYRIRRAENYFSGSTWNLALVSPVDEMVDSVEAVVTAPRGMTAILDVSADDLSWEAASPTTDQTGSAGSHRFVASRPESTLPLQLSATSINQPEATIVDRVWLQTWLAEDMRQDRAAFRFRTAASQATIELPPGTASQELEVLVGGAPATVRSRAAGRIVVDLAPPAVESGEKVGSTELEYTLELRWRLAIREALLTRHHLTPPQLVGTTALAQVYWQIVLPGDRHVVRSPDRLVSASQWQWLGSFWGRQPVHSQAELEDWVGASTQLGPATAQNEYLYTGPAPVLSIEIITAPRWLMVLSASGTGLALVLCWIYLPAVRRRWIVACLACAIAVLAIAFPVPALLIAETSVLGVLVGVVSAFIWQLTSRPARRPATASGGSSRQFTPRADSIVMPPVGATASTAPTATLNIPDSE